jgi:hypothetical protein
LKQQEQQPDQIHPTSATLRHLKVTTAKSEPPNETRRTTARSEPPNHSNSKSSEKQQQPSQKQQEQ